MSCVCHVHSPEVLIFSFGQYSPAAHWLVALSFTVAGLWDESDRLVPADNANANIMCALNDSTVLLGQWYTKYLELVRVESAAGDTGSRIKRGRRLRESDDMEEYRYFSATGGGSELLVAMSYSSYDARVRNSVRVHRLRGIDDEHFELEELTRVDIESKLIKPRLVLWHRVALKERLLITEWDDGTQSEAIVEFHFRAGRLERGSELVPKSEGLSVTKWCVDGDHVALFDWNLRQILCYSLA